MALCTLKAKIANMAKLKLPILYEKSTNSDKSKEQAEPYINTFFLLYLLEIKALREKNITNGEIIKIFNIELSTI